MRFPVRSLGTGGQYRSVWTYAEECLSLEQSFPLCDKTSIYWYALNALQFMERFPRQRLSLDLD